MAVGDVIVHTRLRELTTLNQRDTPPIQTSNSVGFLGSGWQSLNFSLKSYLMFSDNSVIGTETRQLRRVQVLEYLGV
jgi:hypothetical protein